MAASNKQEEKTSMLEIIFWVLSSILCSVCLIILVKYIMKNFGFNFVLTLTAGHFCCQLILLETFAMLGIFKANRMPAQANIQCAIVLVGSIAFMNFSLRFNSVGFYQVAKLACIPTTMLVQKLFYGASFTRRITWVLALIISGVGIAVVTDVEINATGCVMGIMAIIFTVLNQVWMGHFQKLHQINGQQFMHSIAICVVAVVGICASCIEGFPQLFGGDETSSVLNYTFTFASTGAIFGSCVLATGVNVATANLIRVTSAVTYQVVGHAKTILVLTGGFLLFPVEASAEQIAKNMLGIAVAMVGVVLYGHLQHSQRQGTEDCLIKYCRWNQCLTGDYIADVEMQTNNTKK